MAEQAGKDCVIKISGAKVSMTSEATTTSDNKTYQITNVVKQVLDRTAPPTVQVAGVTVTTGFTINYLSGSVIFSSVNGGGAVTVSGYYLPMATAAYANKMNHHMAADILDITPFLATYKKRMAGLNSASGSLSQFNITDATYSAALKAGVPVVIEDRTSGSALPNRFWALLDSDEVEAAIAGIQNETITWISHDSWLKLGV